MNNKMSPNYREMNDEQLHNIYNYGEGNGCIGGSWDCDTLEYRPRLGFEEWKTKVIEDELRAMGQHAIDEIEKKLIKARQKYPDFNEVTKKFMFWDNFNFIFKNYKDENFGDMVYEKCKEK